MENQMDYLRDQIGQLEQQIKNFEQT